MEGWREVISRGRKYYLAKGKYLRCLDKLRSIRAGTILKEKLAVLVLKLFDFWKDTTMMMREAGRTDASIHIACHVSGFPACDLEIEPTTVTDTVTDMGPPTQRPTKTRVMPATPTLKQDPPPPVMAEVYMMQRTKSKLPTASSMEEVENMDGKSVGTKKDTDMEENSPSETGSSKASPDGKSVRKASSSTKTTNTKVSTRRSFSERHVIEGEAHRQCLAGVEARLVTCGVAAKILKPLDVEWQNLCGRGTRWLILEVLGLAETAPDFHLQEGRPPEVAQQEDSNRSKQKPSNQGSSINEEPHFDTAIRHISVPVEGSAGRNGKEERMPATMGAGAGLPEAIMRVKYLATFLLKADEATVLLAEGHGLSRCLCKYEKLGQLEGDPLPLGRSLLNVAWECAEVVLENNPQNNPAFNPMIDRLNKNNQISAMLCLPLITSENDCLGVVCLTNHQRLNGEAHRSFPSGAKLIAEHLGRAAGSLISNAIRTKESIIETRRLHNLLRQGGVLGRLTTVRGVGNCIAQQLKESHQARLVLVYQVQEGGKSLLKLIGCSDDHLGRKESIDFEMELLLSRACSTAMPEYVAKGIDGACSGRELNQHGCRNLILPLVHTGQPQQFMKMEKDLSVLPQTKGLKRGDGKRETMQATRLERPDRRVKGIALILDRDHSAIGQSDRERPGFSPKMVADLLQYGRFAARALWRESETGRVNNESSLEALTVGQTLSTTMRKVFSRAETQPGSKLIPGSWEAYRAGDPKARGFLETMQYDEWTENFLKKAMFVHRTMLKMDNPRGMVSLPSTAAPSRAPSCFASRSASPTAFLPASAASLRISSKAPSPAWSAKSSPVASGHTSRAPSPFDTQVPFSPRSHLPISGEQGGILSMQKSTTSKPHASPNRCSEDILKRMRQHRHLAPSHKRRHDVVEGISMKDAIKSVGNELRCLKLSNDLRKTSGWANAVEERLLQAESLIDSSFSSQQGFKGSAEWAEMATKVIRWITKSATVRLYLKPWDSIFTDLRNNENRFALQGLAQARQSTKGTVPGTHVLSLTIGNIVSNKNWVAVVVPPMRGISGRVLDNHGCVKKRKSQESIFVIEEDADCPYDGSVDIPKHTIGSSYIVTAPMYLPGVVDAIGTVQCARHGTDQNEDGPYRNEEKTTTFCFAANMALRLTTLLLQGTMGSHFDTLHSYQQSFSLGLFEAKRKRRAPLRYLGTPMSSTEGLTMINGTFKRQASSMINPAKTPKPVLRRFAGSITSTSITSALVSAPPTPVQMSRRTSTMASAAVSRRTSTVASAAVEAATVAVVLPPEVPESIETRVKNMQNNAVRRAAQRSLCWVKGRQELFTVAEEVTKADNSFKVDTVKRKGAEALVRWSRDPILRAASQLTRHSFDGGPRMKKKEILFMSPAHQRLYLVLDALRDQLDAEIAVFYLLDPYDPNVMVSVCKSHVYQDVEIEPPVTVKIGAGITGSSFKSGEVICGGTDHVDFDQLIDKPTTPIAFEVSEVVALPLLSSDFYMRWTVNAGVQLIRQKGESEQGTNQRKKIMAQDVNAMVVLKQLLIQCVCQIILESKVCLRAWQVHLTRQLAECISEYKFPNETEQANHRHAVYLRQMKGAAAESKAATPKRSETPSLLPQKYLDSRRVSVVEQLDLDDELEESELEKVANRLASLAPRQIASPPSNATLQRVTPRGRRSIRSMLCMFKEVVQAEVAVLWLAKERNKIEGRTQLVRRYVCYELTEGALKEIPEVIQPCFGFMTNREFKLGHLEGDKTICEPGQGIVGTALAEEATTHLKLDEDPTTGELVGRGDIYSPAVDLPPGMTPKAMSTVCVPVVYYADEKLRERRRSTVYYEEDEHFAEPTLERWLRAAQAERAAESARGGYGLNHGTRPPTALDNLSSRCPSRAASVTNGNLGITPNFNSTDSNQEQGLVGMLQFVNKSHLWGKKELFSSYEVEMMEGFAEGMIGYIIHALNHEACLRRCAAKVQRYYEGLAREARREGRKRIVEALAKRHEEEEEFRLWTFECLLQEAVRKKRQWHIFAWTLGIAHHFYEGDISEPVLVAQEALQELAAEDKVDSSRTMSIDSRTIRTMSIHSTDTWSTKGRPSLPQIQPDDITITKEQKRHNFDSQLAELGGDSMWAAMMGGNVESAMTNLAGSVLAPDDEPDDEDYFAAGKMAAKTRGMSTSARWNPFTKRVEQMTFMDNSDDEDDEAGAWAAVL